MDFDRFMRGLSGQIEAPVQKHLKNVYSSVSLSAAAAAVGGYVHIFTSLASGGFMSALAAIGFMLALAFTPFDGKNMTTRLGYLVGFAFCSGLGMGPLLQMSALIEPSLISTALMLTSAVFVSFSLAAVYSKRAHFLYLAGFLGSALSALFVLGLANIFFRSNLIFQVELYGGLLVFCAFVLYDTQLIMERCRQGDRDYVWHALMLFVDLIDIFRHVLVILMQKEERGKKKRN